MTRKTYYYILLIILSLFFVDFFIPVGYRPVHAYVLRNFAAAFILISETLLSKRPYRILNEFVIPIAFVGYLFLVMHWPLGWQLFVGAIMAALILLFINVIKNETNKVTHIIILTIPLIHYLDRVFKLFHLAGSGPLLIFEWVAYLLAIITLIIGLVRRTLVHPTEKC